MPNDLISIFTSGDALLQAASRRRFISAIGMGGAIVLLPTMFAVTPQSRQPMLDAVRSSRHVAFNQHRWVQGRYQ